MASIRKQNPKYLLSRAEYLNLVCATAFKLLKYLSVIPIDVNTHTYVHIKENYESVPVYHPVRSDGTRYVTNSHVTPFCYIELEKQLIET